MDSEGVGPRRTRDGFLQGPLGHTHRSIRLVAEGRALARVSVSVGRARNLMGIATARDVMAWVMGKYFG